MRSDVKRERSICSGANRWSSLGTCASSLHGLRPWRSICDYELYIEHSKHQELESRKIGNDVVTLESDNYKR